MSLHDEYTELLAGELTNTCQIKVYSRMKTNNGEVYKPYVDNVTFHRLEFGGVYLTAAVLAHLLPGLSVQQEEALYGVFEKIKFTTNNRPVSDVVTILEEEIKEIEKIAKEPPNKPGPQAVRKALISKIKGLKMDGILTDDKIPEWTKPQKHVVHIICGDYAMDEFGKRLISAVLECFLRVKTTGSIRRLLVIEEAHQLVSTDNKKSAKLITQLLREARKFHTSVLLSTQNYDDLDANSVSQCLNSFKFRDHRDPDLAGLCARQCFTTLSSSRTSFVMNVGEEKTFKERIRENK